MRRALGLLAVVLMTSCTAKLPPSWASGGSRLTIQTARWVRGDSTYEIRPDGKVIADGEAVLGIDAVGRVFETDGDAVAVLQTDGHLVGKDDASMGFVGPVSATFPGSDRAWFSIGSNGQVVRYDGESPATPDGAWLGCEGPAGRTCALVTHVVLLRELRNRPRMGIGFGFGMGFGVMH